MASPDVIVIGLGVMGLSTCAALAGRGARVLGIEQFDLGHAMGSSHGATRIFRTAYFEHPDYVPLLRQSLAMWRALEAEAGSTLFIDTGALYMGPSTSELVRGAIASAGVHHIPIESLDPAQIRQRYPQFSLPENTIGVLEKQTAGMILAERALTAFARCALAGGAQLATREKLVSWTAGGNLVRVITDRAIHEAAHLVFCGGGWSERLMADLKLPLRATRQLSGWFWPSDSAPFASSRFPIWAIETAPSSGGHGAARSGAGAAEGPHFYYGFPLHAADIGLKAACHDPAETFDPESRDRRAQQEELAGLRAMVGQYIPGAAGQTLKVQVCLYTMTPDGHFLIDRHPGHQNVHFACGFSGHGFKFAPVIGEVMADLTTRGATSYPVGFLSLARFGPPKGAEPQESHRRR